MLKPKTLILLLVTFLSASFVNAQENNKTKEPTLEETIEFITIKTLQSSFVYNSTGQRHIYSDDCEFNHQSFSNIKTIKIEVKNLIAKELESCGTAELYFYLENIKTMSIGSQGWRKEKKNDALIFTSVEPIIRVYKDRKNNLEEYSVEKPTRLELRFTEEDTPKMFKAFNHLFKLLGIKLVEDKF